MISDEFEKTLQRTQSYAKKFGHFYMTLGIVVIFTRRSRC